MTDQANHQVNQPQIWEGRFHCVKEKVARTLQGYIHFARDARNDSKMVVVKETSQKLVAEGKSQDGHVVHEDFANEKMIMNYLALQPDSDVGFVRLIHQWDTATHYFYAMQHCEAELFKYISKAFTQDGEMFKLMQRESQEKQVPCANKLSSHTWLTRVRGIFRQCVQCVFWMHNKGVCHLDLSLENTMIFQVDGLHVKIIDFGLAKLFDRSKANGNNEAQLFQYNKRVGKRGYMAPEVYDKIPYDARKADTWSLGVMLFMMLVGAPPYKRATTKDAAFNYIINGMLSDVLKHWRRLRLVSKDALDCMEKIFCWEKDRISMKELVAHPFVDLKHLLATDGVDYNTSYVRVSNALTEYHNGYVLPMQVQMQLVQAPAPAPLPRFADACPQVLAYGSVTLLNDFQHLLAVHGANHAHALRRLFPSASTANAYDDEGQRTQSLSRLYDSILDAIENKSFVDVQNSIVVRRCFRKRVKCEDEKALLDVYGAQNKEVIGNDELRIAMQIMDKIYFYFAYTYQFGFALRDDEMKQLEEADADAAEQDDAFTSSNKDVLQLQQIAGDPKMRRLLRLLKLKKEALATSAHGPLIYEVVRDRQLKFCLSSSNYFFPAARGANSDDSNESKEQPIMPPQQHSQSQHKNAQPVPAPLTKLFKAFKNKLQQHLIEMQKAPRTMNHRDLMDFLKTLQSRSKKESQLESIKKLSSDDWRKVHDKFVSVQMTEASLQPMFKDKREWGKLWGKTKQEFGRLLIALYKIVPAELKRASARRFFTEKDRVEKLDAREIVLLVLAVFRDSYKLDIDNDMDLELFRSLMEQQQMTGAKLYSLDEELMIATLIAPCLRRKFDVIDAHRFGKRYRYWPAYSDNKSMDLLNGFFTHHWYVRPKFSDIKDEILNNQLSHITVNQWNRIVLYASKIVIKCAAIKRLKASVVSNQKEGGSTANSSYNKYGVKNGDRIRLEHLVPLLIYVNLDFVSKALIESYNNNNDLNNDYGTYIKCMRHHSQLSHLARLVRETVECYGMKYSNVAPQQQQQLPKPAEARVPNLYVLADKNIHPSSLYARVFGPISATSSLNAALILNDGQGDHVVYELQSVSQSNARVFDCSWLSDYPYEYEHIICGGVGCQMIANILDVPLSCNYRRHVAAMQILMDVVHGRTQTSLATMSPDELQQTGMALGSMMTHRYLMEKQRQSGGGGSGGDDDQKNEATTTEPFIHAMFAAVCKNVCYAQIEMRLVVQSELLAGALCTKTKSLAFDRLNAMFPNVSRYLVSLQEIEGEKQEKIIFSKGVVKFLKNINESTESQSTTPATTTNTTATTSHVQKRLLKVQSLKYQFVSLQIEETPSFQEFEPKLAQIGWKLSCSFDDVPTLAIDYAPHLKLG